MYSRKTEVQIHSLSPLLSEAIKRCRTALDMSPQSLARKIGRHPAFVTKLENAEVAIDSQSLEDCASAFGLSVGELVELALSKNVLVVASIESKKGH